MSTYQLKSCSNFFSTKVALERHRKSYQHLSSCLIVSSISGFHPFAQIYFRILSLKAGIWSPDRSLRALRLYFHREKYYGVLYRDGLGRDYEDNWRLRIFVWRSSILSGCVFSQGFRSKMCLSFSPRNIASGYKGSWRHHLFLLTGWQTRSLNFHARARTSCRWIPTCCLVR